jgi:hypothetical protein
MKLRLTLSFNTVTGRTFIVIRIDFRVPAKT